LGQFLLEITPLSKRPSSLDPKDYKDFLKKFVNKCDETFDRDVHNLYIHFSTWVARMESIINSNTSFGEEKIMSNSNLIHDRLMYRTKLIITG
jgi:WASH complex subunit 7, N-terminal